MRAQFCAVAILLISPLLARAAFVDVTDFIGFELANKKSFGNPTWVDLDSDGWLDLVIPHHGDDPNFYIGDGIGGFRNITDDTGMSSELPVDRHGWAWADYDNDGDTDVFIQVGAFSVL